MRNRHKVKVRGVRRLRLGTFWYVSCGCGWEPITLHEWPDGPRYARQTWDAAFALGVAHQRQMKDECNCG